MTRLEYATKHKELMPQSHCLLKTGETGKGYEVEGFGGTFGEEERTFLERFNLIPKKRKIAVVMEIKEYEVDVTELAANENYTDEELIDIVEHNVHDGGYDDLESQETVLIEICNY